MMIGNKQTGFQHRGHRGTLGLQPHFPQGDRQAPGPMHPPRSPGRCLLNPQSTLTSSGCFRKHRAAFPARYDPKNAKKRLIGHSFSTTGCPEGVLKSSPRHSAVLPDSRASIAVFTSFWGQMKFSLCFPPHPLTFQASIRRNCQVFHMGRESAVLLL